MRFQDFEGQMGHRKWKIEAFHPHPTSENPPRPLASRRVEFLTQQQTLQTSQNLQTNLLGGGFTLPLLPPNRSGLLSRSFSESPRGYLDPSKNATKNHYFFNISPFRPHQSIAIKNSSFHAL